MKTENTISSTPPMLFPISPDQFWQTMRHIIREEISQLTRNNFPDTSYQTPGLQEKPLYKMAELCSLLQVSKPTIYEWIRYGKLKPYKIRSRVYFLWQDVQQLIVPEQTVPSLSMSVVEKGKAA
ncbi:MAG: DNA-binding protein [Chitinophagaceae bacterium]|nr:MAG: DNA-binding protein [Chitinophagaceae bacterium]